MIIETITEKGLLIVTIKTAEASLKNSDAFKAGMVALIEEGHHHIVINFEHVNYIDSSFLGALVSSLKYAISKHGDLSLTNLKKDIYSLFQLIRVDKVFKIYRTNEEAMEQHKP